MTYARDSKNKKNTENDVHNGHNEAKYVSPPNHWESKSKFETVVKKKLILKRP